MYVEIDELEKIQNINELDTKDKPIYQLQGIPNTNYAKLIHIGYGQKSLIPVHSFEFMNKYIKIHSIIHDITELETCIISIIRLDIDDNNSIHIKFNTDGQIDLNNQMTGKYKVYFNNNIIYEMDNWCENNKIVEYIAKFLVHKSIIEMFYS